MKEVYTQKELDIVLKILARSQTTAPVEISFGYVDSSNICRNGIVLKNAAPAIIEMLIKEKCLLSLTAQGVHVTIL